MAPVVVGTETSVSHTRALPLIMDLPGKGLEGRSLPISGTADAGLSQRKDAICSPGKWLRCFPA